MGANLIENSIREELTAAAEYIRRGRVHVERQRQLVETLKRDGHEIGSAAALLKVFEETQELHEVSVMRLAQELAAFQIKQSIADQSRSELRRRDGDLKASNQTLASAVDAIEGSRSLLDSLPEKP